VFTAAIELPILKYGECKSFEEDLIRLYLHRAGYSISFLVKNLNLEWPLIFKCDVSESENAMSHRGSLEMMETIQSGQRLVVHHLFPQDYELKNEFKWAYSASYMFEDDA
jgi:hypothetical protein